MNKVLSILKAIGGFAASVAPAAATLLGGPALGVLTQTIITAILTSEKPGVPGEQKKATAMQGMSVAAPGIIALIEQTTGRQLVDEAKFQEALSRMIDAGVSLLDAFQLLPKSTPAATPAPAK